MPPPLAESWGMDKPTKMTFGEMRESGVRGVIYLTSCVHLCTVAAVK
jgi:hypothetical protein